MGFSPSRAFTSVFNWNAPVRAGLVCATAVCALGMPLAMQIFDSPSAERGDAGAAVTEMQVLQKQFASLKDSEKTLRFDLQAKTSSGGGVDKQVVQQIADAHTAFTKSVLFSRDISERDFAGIRDNYVASFGETYKYTTRYVDSEKVERTHNYNLSGLSDAASFKECQNKYMTTEGLSKPDYMLNGMSDCLSNPNGFNFLGGLAIFGVIALSLGAGFNTESLRSFGQDIKDRQAEKDMAARAAVDKALADKLKL